MTPRTAWLIVGLAASVTGGLALWFAPTFGFDWLLLGIAAGVALLSIALWTLRRSALPPLVAVAIPSAAGGFGLLWLGAAGGLLLVLAGVCVVLWLVLRARRVGPPA